MESLFNEKFAMWENSENNKIYQIKEDSIIYTEVKANEVKVKLKDIDLEYHIQALSEAIQRTSDSLKAFSIDSNHTSIKSNGDSVREGYNIYLLKLQNILHDLNIKILKGEFFKN